MGFLRQSDEILSVGEFSLRFKTLIKMSIPELWLRGEVSNLKTYSSGHTYFTLKDETGAISAVLFKGYGHGSSLRLADGMKILAFGEISIYETRGNYQIIVKAFMPDGMGDLSSRFEELKKKLSQEGLFDSSRKKKIPDLPKNIAVVTSETGAAIRDFLSILRRRKWGGDVTVLPSRVQGPEAAAEIVAAIKIAQKMNFDLLIVMRGGGSLEDLWPFNEEIVARAVAASAIPTISAVGHEIDFTLSDFAADLRAETPSAAAEYISSKFIEIRDDLKNTALSISEYVRSALSNVHERLLSAEELFLHASPSGRLASLAISLDESEGKLKAVLFEALTEKKSGLASLEGEFARLCPMGKIELLRANLDSLEKQLELLSVDGVLKRGFTMALSADGKIIKRVKDAPNGFKLKFYDGEADVYLNT